MIEKNPQVVNYDSVLDHEESIVNPKGVTAYGDMKSGGVVLVDSDNDFDAIVARAERNFW